MSSADSPVGQLAERLRVFADERDWQRFHTPKNLAMALAGEVGELLAELQWLTPDESVSVMEDPAAGQRVRAEIGDVMIYLTRLADLLGVDLVEAAHDKLVDSARRYPADRVRGVAVKAPHHDAGTPHRTAQETRDHLAELVRARRGLETVYEPVAPGVYQRQRGTAAVQAYRPSS